MATKKTSTNKAGDAIGGYSTELSAEHAAVCDALRKSIDAAIPKATSKIWHGSPVWFIGENPVVGYASKAGSIALLFWNGQAFKRSELTIVGKFHAAEIRYNNVSDINTKVLNDLLKLARNNVFDSVGMIKAARAKHAKAKAKATSVAKKRK